MITNKQKQWFTLVELIVVITILAILWTIAFIALQGYSKTARDSARISDMSRIKSSLELFAVEAGKYPEPTDAVAVTYSWTTEAWNQGNFWENTFRVVERLDKKPVDPTTEKEYTYSVTNSRKEYQLAWILETTDFAQAPSPTGRGLGWGLKANAWETLATARIIWNYNWQMLKVLKGNDLTILASPSIICSENLTLEECIAQNKLAYDGFKNLPPSFAGTQYKQLWEAGSLTLVNNTADIVIYDWKKSDLVEDSEAAKTVRKTVVEKLQAAYSSTKIADREWIRRLVNVDTTDATAVESLWVAIVNNKINSGMITASKLSVEAPTTSTSSTTTWWCVFGASTFGDCIIWWETTPTYLDCSATTQNSYSIPALTHWETQSVSKTVDVTNGTQTYTQDFSCTDGQVAWSNEVAWEIVLNWECWSDNGVNLRVTPTNLCNIGDASTVTDNWAGSTYDWTCWSVSCSANNTNWDNNYPWCDTDNIKVWSITIAACNVWTNIAWVTSVSYGDYYQFWKTDTSFTDNWTGYWDNWLAHTYWWVSKAEQTTATYKTSTAESRAKMQWPCADWYHVPTAKEWRDLYAAWAWWENGTQMSNDLKLPYGWYNHVPTLDSNWASTQGSRWMYRSSSPNAWSSWKEVTLMVFESNFITENEWTSTANAVKVRCFKN